MENDFLPLLNNSSFTRINQFIHAYNIPGLHDKLLPFKNGIVTKFVEEIEEYRKKGLYNIELDDDLEWKVNDFTYQLVKKYYDIGEERCSYSRMGAYVQDNTESTYILHNHVGIRGLTTMVATMYIVPMETKEEGGGLFVHFPEKIINTEIGVLKDWIYLIPAYVGHRPIKQTSPKYRVCLNWTLEGRTKPLNLLSGDAW